MPAILIFLAFANTIARLGCCNSDGVLAVCMLLSVVFGERFRESSRIRYALLAGIFCGFAMETQSFGVLVVPLAATQVLLSRVKKSQTPILASMAALIIPALLLALPWYLNSFANTGIPSICNLSALPNSSVGSSPNTTVSLPMAPGIFNGLRHIGSASWSFTLFGHLHRTNALGLLPFVAMPFMLFANLPIKIRYVLLWIVLFLVQLIAIELWIIPGGSVFRHSLFLLLLSSPLVVWLISHLSNRPVLR
jgi:4-amino-4-deoxy-L-arabinose transferase-like glycosyltransferase